MPVRSLVLKAREAFKKRDRARGYPEAVATLAEDWERMDTFHDIPEECTGSI